MVNVGGWIQFLAGAFGLLQQGYQLFNGMPLDLTHSGIAAGLLAGGLAHLRNGNEKNGNHE